MPSKNIFCMYFDDEYFKGLPANFSISVPNDMGFDWTQFALIFP